MPTAPLYNGPTVSKAAMPGPMLNPGSVTPDAFGAGIARGIGVMSNVAKDIWAEEQQKANDVAITSAISKAHDVKTQYMYGQKTEDKEAGIMLLEGENLFRNANGKQKAFQDELSGIQNSLATPQLRSAFQRQTMGMHNEFGQSLAIRIAGERKKTFEKTYDVALNTISNSFQQDAVQGVNLPTTMVSEAEMAVRSTIEKKHQALGTSLVPGQIDDEVRQHMFSMTAGALGGIADNNNRGAVETWIGDRTIAHNFSPATVGNAIKWLRTADKHSIIVSAGQDVESELAKADEQMIVSRQAPLSGADRIKLADELIKSRFKGDPGLGADIFHNFVYQDNTRVAAMNSAYAEGAKKIESRIENDATTGKGNYSKWRYPTLEALSTDPLFSQLPAAHKEGLRKYWIDKHESFKPEADAVHVANMVEWKKIERAPLAVKRAFLSLNIAAINSDGDSLFAPQLTLDQRDTHPEHVVFNYLFGTDEPALRNAKIVQLASTGKADKQALMALQGTMGNHIDAMDSGWGKSLDAAVKDVAETNLKILGIDKDELSKQTTLHVSDLVDYFSKTLKPGEIPTRDDVAKASSRILTQIKDRGYIWDSKVKRGTVLSEKDLKKIYVPIKQIPTESVKIITENWKKLNKGALPSTEQIQNEYAKSVYDQQMKASSSLLPLPK